MSKNHLTEGKICAISALHTRVSGVRKAETHEGVLTPHLILYVLRSNCPSLSVKLDTPLLSAVPLRARATFVELLCGCLISPEDTLSLCNYFLENYAASLLKNFLPSKGIAF